MANKYPQRPKHFSQKVVRRLMKTCAAQDIGQSAALLVIVVVATEDAARYRRPVTFYNEQLLPLIGVKKWDALDKARKSAVDAGWLVYDAPPKGSRKPGRYWATIPPHLDGFDDGPVDEGSEIDTREKGNEEEIDTPKTDNEEPKAYPLNGYGQGEGRGDTQGELSYPSPSPIVRTNEEEIDTPKTDNEDRGAGTPTPEQLAFAKKIFTELDRVLGTGNDSYVWGIAKEAAADPLVEQVVDEALTAAEKRADVRNKAAVFVSEYQRRLQVARELEGVAT